MLNASKKLRSAKFTESFLKTFQTFLSLDFCHVTQLQDLKKVSWATKDR